MADINTVSISGVLTSNVATSKTKDLSVARFYIDVEGAGDKRPCGNFKVVTFAEWAELAKKLSEGDRVILVGALLERRGRGDVSPENCTSYNVRKTKPVKSGDLDGKEDLYTRTDYQQVEGS